MRTRAFVSLLVVVLLLGLADSASALDYGVNLNSRTDVSEDELFARNSASAWLRSVPRPSSDSLTVHYLLQASVYSEVESIEWEAPEHQFYPDLDLANVTLIVPELLLERTRSDVTVGRLSASEPTGLIFSDRIDGIAVKVGSSTLSVDAAVGYTGLFDGRTHGLALSIPDTVDQNDPDVWSASQRIIADTRVTFLGVPGRQIVSFGALGQWDLRPDDPETFGERIDSQYAYLAVDGTIVPSVYHESAVAGSYTQITNENTGGEDDGFGFAARTALSAYFGADDRSNVDIGARYWFGAEDTADSFRPLSPVSEELLIVSRQQDALVTRAAYSYRPLAGRRGPGAQRLELSPYLGAVFGSDLLAADPFQGAEAGLRVSYRPLSDLGTQLWIAGSNPDGDFESIEAQGRFELSLSF